MGSLERLAEIDRELDSFGKADDLLDGVVRRARDEAKLTPDRADAELAALAEQARTPIAASAAGVATNGAPRVQTLAPPGESARPASWDRPGPPAEIPEDASGLVEVPEEVLRREELPPVLELEGIAPATGGGGAPSGAAGGSDAAGAASEGPGTDPPRAATEGGLADLFESDPLDGSRPPGESGAAAQADGLADLFDEPSASDRPEAEPGAHEGLADLLDSDLAAELGLSEHSTHAGDAGEADAPLEPEPTSVLTAAEVHAIRGSVSSEPAELDAELDAQLDGMREGAPADDARAIGESASESEPLEPSEMPSTEFELMIDEDVLVLDDEGDVEASADEPARPATSPPPAPTSGSSASQPPPKGFFSRILNRK